MDRDEEDKLLLAVSCRFMRLSVPFDVKGLANAVFEYSSPGIIIDRLNPMASV